MNNMYCVSEEFEDEIINDGSWLTDEPEEEECHCGWIGIGTCPDCGKESGRIF